MSLVLDASVAVAWYFEDETTPATDAILERVSEGGAVVPTLWRLEVASAFQAAIRRRRTDTRFRDEALAELAELAIAVDTETYLHAWAATLRMAERWHLTVYDAAYLELAQRKQLPLSSLDQDLRRAASALGVTLFDG